MTTSDERMVEAWKEAGLLQDMSEDIATIAESAAQEFGFIWSEPNWHVGFTGSNRAWVPPKVPKVTKRQMYPRIVENRNQVWINGLEWSMSIVADPVTGTWSVVVKGKMDDEATRHFNRLIAGEHPVWKDIKRAWMMDKIKYQEAPYLRKIPGVGEKNPDKNQPENIRTSW